MNIFTENFPLSRLYSFLFILVQPPISLLNHLHHQCGTPPQTNMTNDKQSFLTWLSSPVLAARTPPVNTKPWHKCYPYHVEFKSQAVPLLPIVKSRLPQDLLSKEHNNTAHIKLDCHTQNYPYKPDTSTIKCLSSIIQHFILAATQHNTHVDTSSRDPTN